MAFAIAFAAVLAPALTAALAAAFAAMLTAAARCFCGVVLRTGKWFVGEMILLDGFFVCLNWCCLYFIVVSHFCFVLVFTALVFTVFEFVPVELAGRSGATDAVVSAVLGKWIACEISAGHDAHAVRVREALELALAKQRTPQEECVSELQAKASQFMICINALRPAVDGHKDLRCRLPSHILHMIPTFQTFSDNIPIVNLHMRPTTLHVSTAPPS